MRKSIEGLGSFLIQASESSGFGLRLLGRTVAALPAAATPRRTRDVLDLLFGYSVSALPVVIVVSVFVGMILALNFLISVESIGIERTVGRVVAVSMVREMGPFMTALILAASLGSGIAAEIGSMRVSEEIDALEIMSISPVRFLVLPRVVTMILLCPVMTAFAAVLGILGGASIGYFQYEISWATFENDALELLTFKDVYTGMLKSAVFGATIGVVGCTQGLLARGGATGVGAVTRRSVVVSFLLCLIFGYVITWIFFQGLE